MAHRLAPRLQAALPLEELAELAAEALLACPDLRRKAERRMTFHKPTPQWARDTVLLSNDLVPRFIGQLEMEDDAAAKVCTAWRDGWKATNALRRWLRPAPVQPPALQNVTSIYSMAAAPDGERLCLRACSAAAVVG